VWLFCCSAHGHVGDLGVVPRLAGELEHHLVGDLVGEPPRLRRHHREALRGDLAELGRGEIVEPHLPFETIGARRENPLQRGVRARCGRVAPRLLHGLGVPDGERRLASHHAEQGGELEVVRRHLGQRARIPGSAPSR
jgi:hypothetical protein